MKKKIKILIKLLNKKMDQNKETKYDRKLKVKMTCENFYYKFPITIKKYDL